MGKPQSSQCFSTKSWSNDFGNRRLEYFLRQMGVSPAPSGEGTKKHLAWHKKHKKLSSNIEAIILKMVIFTRQVLFTRGSLAFYPLVHDFRRSSSVSGSMAKGKPARKRLVRFVEDKTSFESGWWFGTCFIFPFSLGILSSQLTVIFFRGVAMCGSPTSNGDPPLFSSMQPGIQIHSLGLWCSVRPIAWFPEIPRDLFL